MVANAAEIEVNLNEAPSAAQLEVSPAFGFTLDTKLSFAVTGASNEQSDMPLKYVLALFLPLVLAQNYPLENVH